MYPFGSGMPSAPKSSNNNSYNPSYNNLPFGAGFQPPTNNPSTYSGHNTPYPNTSTHTTPYPSYSSGNSYQSSSPYPPSSQSHYYNQYPSQTPYPPVSSTNTQYPAPFGAGFQVPRNLQSQPPHSAYPAAGSNSVQQQSPYGQCPYPNSSTNATYPNTSYPYSQNQGMPTSMNTPYPNTTHAFPQSHGMPSSTNTPYPSNSHPIPQTQRMSNSSYHQQSQQHSSYNNMSKCISEMRTSMVHGAKSNTKLKGTPTVIPDPSFDAVKDAHALRKAMKGFGTDEDTLINIICRRSNQQRLEIERQYKTHFGKDLIEDIRSETSGNFENLLVGLLRPIVEFYVTELCDAMSGLGTDEDVLIEVMCTLSNSEIHTIKNAYLRIYGRHLESEMKSETSGNFKRLLISLCAGGRDESGHTDLAQAQHDAKELLKAGELRVGTDESMFNSILCQRNYQQLKLIFDEYQKMTGHPLEKAIKKEFSGDIMNGLLAIYRCVTNKAEYFASRLHKSMAGIGTNDKQLIRVVITRSEIDMQDIKAAFQHLYGKSLKSWIKGDTSGHYKHALYALIGEERSSS